MIRWLVTLGFGLAVSFGIAGGSLPQGEPQDSAWFVSSIGLILGCGVLVLRHAAEGRDLAAVGFAFLAVGEIVMSAGQGSGDVQRLATFARGVGFYVPGLLLLAWSDRYGWPARVLALVTALPFAIHASWHFGGGSPTEAGPLASTGYALLSLTMAAWVWAWYRGADTASPTARDGAAEAAGSVARRL